MSAHTLGSIAPTAKGKSAPPRKGADPHDVINEFQTDTAAIEGRRDPFLARITLHLMGLMILAIITWASLAHVDRIVVSRGKLISTVPSLVIQPLETSIIKSVNVKVGDIVSPGQVLATLDPTFTQADVSQLEARRDALQAQIRRLEAEHADQPFQPGPGANDYMLLQEALWKERQSLYRAQVLGFEEKIARLQAQVRKQEHEKTQFSARLKVVREIEGMRNSLAAAQVGSKLNSLLATDSRIEIERNLSLVESEITEASHEMKSVQADRDAYIQQWQSRIIEDLVTRKNEREGVTEQLVKAQKRKDLVQLEPTVESVVLDIAPRSVGSIIREAEPLITLVPLNVPLEIDASVEPRDIGHIKVGDPVQIKLDAYNFMEHGMLEGEVATISEDTLSSRDGRATDQPYYRARVRILSTDKLYDMPRNFRMIPGMTLSAEIKVGDRSVLSYFLRPILRGFNEGLREP